MVTSATTNWVLCHLVHGVYTVKVAGSLQHFQSMCYKHRKIGCVRSKMKGTLLVEQSTFSSVSVFLLEEIPRIVILITFGTCAINTVNLVAIGQ